MLTACAVHTLFEKVMTSVSFYGAVSKPTSHAGVHDIGVSSLHSEEETVIMIHAVIHMPHPYSAY